MKRVVVIGGGVGGTVLANRLRSKTSKKEVDITLIDKDGKHYYFPHTLFTMLGLGDKKEAIEDESRLLRKGINLITQGVKSIDADNRTVYLADGSSVNYDYLVIATGAELDMDQVPGLAEGAHHFHSIEASLRLKEALEKFNGGRILVGIGGLPYRCPPSPYEATLMIKDYLERKKKLKNFKIEFLSPLNILYPIRKVNKFFEEAFEKKGVNWHTFANVEEVDPNKKEVITMEGDTFKYDLLILVPPHKGVDINYNDGLVDDEGWVITDKYKLTVKDYDDVYSVGDATNLPTSKAGSVAEFEAHVVADRIKEDIKYGSADSTYDGKTLCIVASAIGKAGIIRFDYENEPKPLKESRFNWILKKMYRRYYFSIALKNPLGLNTLFLKLFA